MPSFQYVARDRAGKQVKGVLAACVEAVPALPAAVPGAAVSPGAKIWSFVNAPTLT